MKSRETRMCGTSKIKIVSLLITLPIQRNGFTKFTLIMPHLIGSKVSFKTVTFGVLEPTLPLLKHALMKKVMDMYSSGGTLREITMWWTQTTPLMLWFTVATLGSGFGGQIKHGFLVEQRLFQQPLLTK